MVGWSHTASHTAYIVRIIYPIIAALVVRPHACRARSRPDRSTARAWFELCMRRAVVRDVLGRGTIGSGGARADALTRVEHTTTMDDG